MIPTRIWFCFLIIIGLIFWLTACATAWVPSGATPQLTRDQGLLAIGLDQNGAEAIKWGVIGRKGGGYAIHLSKLLEPGLSLKLYVVPAGTYCLNKYIGDLFEATFKNSLCTRVNAGRLAYFGHLSPVPFGGGIYQTFQYELLYEELKTYYPGVFTQYANDLEKPKLNPVQDITPSATHNLNHPKQATE